MKAAVAKRESEVESGVVLQEGTEIIKGCPHCYGEKIVKNGMQDGNKGFVSSRARRPFNVLTGTLLARLRMADRHTGNARCMVAGLSAVGHDIPAGNRGRMFNSPASLSGGSNAAGQAGESLLLSSGTGRPNGKVIVVPVFKTAG